MKPYKLGAILGITAAALIAIVAWSQEVLAPGHEPDYPPLPRYTYNVVAADFNKPVGHPLIKTKFNLFAGARADEIGVKTTPLMAALKVDNYRGSIGWGRSATGGGPGMVSGTPDKLVYNFEAQDRLVKLLKSHDIELLMCYSRTPEPLQEPAGPGGKGDDRWPRKGGSAAPPRDLNKWKEVIRTVVKHYKDIGMPFQVHEVWNEPDGTYQFFNGTPAEYEQVYKATVEAVREVEPDAVVAGPSADHHILWNTSFIDFVYKNKLPLDHYTFHEYGSGELAVRQIERVNSSLNRYRYFDTTGLSLDEYHDGECCDWYKDDVRNRFQGAAEMMHDFTLLLGRPELLSISWAWWMDTRPSDGAGGMGLLNVKGRTKAVYNAWKAYAMMPVDRYEVSVEGSIEGIASRDEHKAGLMLWNRSTYDRLVDVQLKNLPFKKGTVRIYRIDKDHASYVDGGSEDLQVNETYPITDGTWSYVDTWVQRNSTVYFEAVDDTGVSEQTPAKVADIIRINHYYPARGKVFSFADFDRRTWIARLGMMNQRRADERVGVLAKGVPDTLDVAVKLVGKPRRLDASSVVGIRLDYRVGRQYTKAVLFHGGLYDAARKDANPWGLKPQIDEAVAVPDLARFQIPVKNYAPAGWSGEAHISYLMQNAGPGTQAKFTVRPAK